MVSQHSEFTVPNTYNYNRSSPVRWIFSHIWRYKFLFIATCLMYMTAWFSFTYSRILIGNARRKHARPGLCQGIRRKQLRLVGELDQGPRGLAQRAQHQRMADELAALGTAPPQTAAFRCERERRGDVALHQRLACPLAGPTAALEPEQHLAEQLLLDGACTWESDVGLPAPRIEDLLGGLERAIIDCVGMRSGTPSRSPNPNQAKNKNTRPERCRDPERVRPKVQDEVRDPVPSVHVPLHTPRVIAAGTK